MFSRVNFVMKDILRVNIRNNAEPPYKALNMEGVCEATSVSYIQSIIANSLKAILY